MIFGSQYVIIIHLFKIFFLKWPIFKVSIQFVIILLLFYVFFFFFFWLWGIKELSSPTRGRTCTFYMEVLTTEPQGSPSCSLFGHTFLKQQKAKYITDISKASSESNSSQSVSVQSPISGFPHVFFFPSVPSGVSQLNHFFKECSTMVPRFSFKMMARDL